MKDLKVRTISGLIGIAILIGVILLGGQFLGISILILSLIGLREFYQALENIEYKPFYLVGSLISIGIYLSIVFSEIINLEFVMILGILLLLASYLLDDKLEFKIHDLGITLLGALYIPLSLFHIYMLDGNLAIWLIFLIPFGSDTFAYFVGNLFGKRKLSPTISPNKSVEGAIGGVFGSVALSLIFNHYLWQGPAWKFILIGALGSVVSQMGDLIASKIKRTCHIKDYGDLIPGHGGVMDRFDSVLFSGPLIYYAVVYLL